MRRYCVYKDDEGNSINTEFLGVFQHSHTHGDSLMRGGFKAGTVAYPVAVILSKDLKPIEIGLNKIEVIE